MTAGRKLANRAIVLVTLHDHGPYLDDCLASIEEQEFDDLGLLIADDGSTDDSRQRIERFLATTRTVRDHVFVRGDERLGKAARVVELMRHVATDTTAGDAAMVAFLDGDDRLINPHAIRCMRGVLDDGIDVAWSNFRYRRPVGPGREGHVGICRELPVDADPYEHEYVSSHLFCFRAGLFPRIPEANFRDESGAWFRRGCDQCFTLPLLHLARERRFVPEFFVEYNNATPWQNDADGAAAAAAVELVRRRGFVGAPAPAPAPQPTAAAWLAARTGDAMPAEPGPRLEEVEFRARQRAAAIGEALARSQNADGSFDEPDFYGRECAVAAWARLGAEHFQAVIDRAIASSRDRMKQAVLEDDATCHWEFILYALSSVGMSLDPGLRRDNQRVINWQLLKAVVDLRLGAALDEGIVERVAANIRDDGALPDFDVAHDPDRTVSDQYHAFSTLLLDELARRRPDHRDVLELRERAVEHLFGLLRGREDFNLEGRGRRQLFGYAAAFRLCARLGETAAMARILDLLDAHARPDGTLPLCLDDREPHRAPQAGWHGYNRWYDYQAFLALHLAGDPMEALA